MLLPRWVSILGMEPDERSRAGLFLAFQYPMEIPGVSNANFLRAAIQARLPQGEELEATEYYAQLYAEMDKLEMSRHSPRARSNEGFSGGEKKRNEFCRWRCSSRNTPCSMRPIPASISTRCASSAPA